LTFNKNKKQTRPTSWKIERPSFDLVVNKSIENAVNNVPNRTKLWEFFDDARIEITAAFVTPKSIQPGSDTQILYVEFTDCTLELRKHYYYPNSFMFVFRQNGTLYATIHFKAGTPISTLRPIFDVPAVDYMIVISLIVQLTHLHAFDPLNLMLQAFISCTGEHTKSVLKKLNANHHDTLIERGRQTMGDILIAQCTNIQ
jgi:hypothetical protein